MTLVLTGMRVVSALVASLRKMGIKVRAPKKPKKMPGAGGPVDLVIPKEAFGNGSEAGIAVMQDGETRLFVEDLDAGKFDFPGLRRGYNEALACTAAAGTGLKFLRREQTVSQDSTVRVRLIFSAGEETESA